MIASTKQLRILDAEEQKVGSYLQAHRPELVELYVAHLERARRGILHRLLMAIIRENIMGIGDRTAWKADAPSVLQVQITEGIHLKAPVSRTHSMGRFDLQGDVLLEQAGHRTVLEHPVHLLDVVRQAGLSQEEGAVQRFERFAQEVQNSVVNSALAFTGAELRKAALQEAAGANVTSTLQWVDLQQQTDPYFSPLVFFEQWVVEGHPLHPGAKIKMGLETADVLEHSPEWGAHPELVPIAVRKQEYQLSSLDGRTSTEILFAEYPGLAEQVESTLQAKGRGVEDYEVIPVHPWQYEHTILPLFAEEIEQGIVVPVPSYRLQTAALLSFRTVAPVQRRGQGKHHIKTAVAVQTTGTFRTISPQSAFNGPLVTSVLQEIQRREQFFDGRFVIMEERVGAFYSPSVDSGADQMSKADVVHRNKNLVAILRENVESQVREGEIAMPGSALLAESPISGKWIVAEMIERFAAHHNITDVQAAAVAFLRRYAEVSLPGFLTVMCRYGVSLEGHLQNSVPVFADGVPVRMILRDFGGVRMLRGRLHKQGLLTDFYPGSVTITDDEVDVRNKIYYPVFQNHFGELITAIVRALGMGEQRLWAPVASVARAVFAALKKDAEIAEQTRADEEALFAEQIDLKAMTTMRLLGDITTYTFARVPNPLADAGEAHA